MPHIKKVAETKKTDHKDIEKELVSAIALLKSELDDKKFKHRIKKAIKVLTHGIGKKKTEKSKVVKTTPKKKVGKKSVKTKKA